MEKYADTKNFLNTLATYLGERIPTKRSMFYYIDALDDIRWWLYDILNQNRKNFPSLKNKDRVYELLKILRLDIKEYCVQCREGMREANMDNEIEREDVILFLKRDIETIFTSLDSTVELIVSNEGLKQLVDGESSVLEQMKKVWENTLSHIHSSEKET